MTHRLTVKLEYLEEKERRALVLASFTDEFLEFFYAATNSIVRQTGATLRQLYMGDKDYGYYGGYDAFDEDIYPLFRFLGIEGRRCLQSCPKKAHGLRQLGVIMASKMIPDSVRTARQFQGNRGAPALQYVASHTIKRAVVHYFFETRTTEKTLRVMARKDGKRDLLCTIRFGPHHHFASAFQCAERMREGTLDEWGRFKVMVNKIGTTQDAVRVYCLRSQTTRTNGRFLVHDYLQRHSETSETYQEAWSALYSVASMWPEDMRLTGDGEPKISSIEEDLVHVLEDYLEGTLLKKKGSSGRWWSQQSRAYYDPCRTRLSNFCYRNPVMAQVLWESYNPAGKDDGNVFATPRSRERFAATLDLGKHSSVLKTAHSVSELTDLLEKRGLIFGTRSSKEGVPLPDMLQRNLDRAQRAYRDAVNGLSIGSWGARYYDSEAMDLALTQLDRAKASARAWRQKQQTQKAKKAVRLGVV